MKDNPEREPKPKAGQPPPRPPRGPNVIAGCGDDGDSDGLNRKKETVRISLPPKPISGGSSKSL